jgi:hypothetical protein
MPSGLSLFIKGMNSKIFKMIKVLAANRMTETEI